MAAFDAVGAGDTDLAGSGGIATASWSHTASGSDRAVVVAAAASINGGTFDVLSATYGGNAMTLLVDEGMDNVDATTRTVLFGLLTPPTGAQTVNVDASGSGTNSVWVAATSVSYTGVSAFGGTDAEFGTGTSRSQTVASATGEMLVQAFGQTHATAMSSYNQTQRDDIYLNDLQDLGVLVGDAAGTGSNVSFTASGPSATWAGVAVRLESASAGGGQFFAFF